MTDSAQARLAQRLAEAQTLQQQGQVTSARLIYQEILAAEPNHYDALNAMGVLAGQTNDLGLPTVPLTRLRQVRHAGNVAGVPIGMPSSSARQCPK